MLKLILFFLLASFGSFLQNNLQFINNWWRDKHVLTVLIFSIPVSLLYIKCHEFIMSNTNSLFKTKFIFFSASNVILAFYAFIFFKENIFSLKNIMCLFLSLLILLIQIKL